MVSKQDICTHIINDYIQELGIPLEYLTESESLCDSTLAVCMNYLGLIKDKRLIKNAMKYENEVWSKLNYKELL